MSLRHCFVVIVAPLLFLSCDETATFSRMQPSLLERIQASGRLKVMTRFDPTTYYEGPEGFTGLEYDLVQLFARQIEVETEFIIPENFSHLLRRIAQGDAHIAAAGITVTNQRKKSLRFAPAYRRITEQLIYRSGNKRPKKIPDLYRGILEIIGDSSHANTLADLKQDYPALEWNTNTRLEPIHLLDLVDKGLIDYTIADSNQVLLIRRYYPKLYVAFDLSQAKELAWALPQDEDTSLYNATVEFFLDIKRNGKLQELIEKHYGHAGALDYVGNCTFRKHFIERLPKYRPFFEKTAEKNHLDWRLLAAIGYQESHWNSNAVSPTGVRGIMMLTAATAKQLGVIDRRDPLQSIEGGARYFTMRKKRIPTEIPEPDQTWMALAAYNVGHGHLQDARILTKLRGGNPNRWISVKEALPLLSEKRWYRKTKHGYARGREPVRYVENIRNYYDLLVWLTTPNSMQKQSIRRTRNKRNYRQSF